MAGEFFTARERVLLGARYDTLYSAPDALFRGVTVNGLRCTAHRFAELSELPLAPSPFCEQAFLLTDAACRPGRSVYHHAGVFYVQEPSAAMPAALLHVRPGEYVLDLCAAPGGKACQLAAALNGQGVLIANEYEAARAAVLRGNLERMGVRNAVILNETSARVSAAFAGFFDKVLVDAPCSGEGMFRKEPQALAQHSAALVAWCAAIGAAILDDAAAALRPGGTLCYSTCTFAPEEDEGQIGAFLARHPEFALLPIEAKAGCPGETARCGAFSFPAERTRRVYPCHGGEGHFMALLQKTGDARRTERAYERKKDRYGKAGREERAAKEVCGAFLREYFPQLSEKSLAARGGSVFLPPLFAVPENLRVVRGGVFLGSGVKGRFEPSHQLFMAYGAQCENAERLTRDDPRVAAWLRGEGISAETAAPGWAAVLVDGFPLGFGRQSGGVVKNRYPKGLRALG